MSPEAISVVMGALGILIGAAVTHYSRALISVRKNAAEIKMAQDQAAADIATRAETRIEAAMAEHIRRLEADGTYLRSEQVRQHDRLAKVIQEWEARENAQRQRADHLEDEYATLRSRYEEMRSYLRYVLRVLRSKRVDVEPFRPGGVDEFDTKELPGSGTHTPLPPDRPKSGG